MDPHETEILKVIDRIDEWQGKEIHFESVTGGITNLNWRVRVGTESFFVKIPGQGTEKFIDRKNCHAANLIAQDTGIGPRACYFFEDTGVEVFEWLEGFKTLKYGDVFAEKKFYKMIDIIKTFHQYKKIELPLIQTLFEQTFTMIKLAIELKAHVPIEINRMEWTARQIEEAIMTAGINYLPCHNDVWTNNFVWDDENQEMKLLDYEYASMNDACCDLASLSTTNYFSEAMDKEIIRYYCGEYDEKLFARFKLYKILSEIKWSMWSCVQTANSNVEDFDYYSWLGTKMARLRYFWSDPRFDYWLDLLKGVTIFRPLNY